MSGVKNLLRRFNHAADRHLADHNIHLHLRKQVGLNLDAAVILRLALLYAAAKHMRNRHAGNANVHHRSFQGLKAGFLADDLHLGKLGRTIIEGRHLLHRDCLGRRNITGYIHCAFIAVIQTLNSRHKVCIGAGKPVFCTVQALDLFFLRYPKPDGLSDDQEGKDHGNSGPGKNGNDTQGLNPEQPETAGIKQAFKPCGRGGVCKQTYSKRAPNAIGQMDAYCTDRVVDMQLQIKRLNHYDDKNTRYNTNDGRAKCIDCITACRDADQACQRAIQTHGHIRLAVLDPCIQHGRTGCNRRGNGGCYKNGSKRIAVPCSSAIEAVPAEPEDKAAKSAKRNGVSGNRIDLLHLAGLILHIFAKTGAYHDGADQSSDTADGVNGSRTGEVMESELCKPALGVPYPTSFDRVNEQ